MKHQSSFNKIFILIFMLLSFPTSGEAAHERYTNCSHPYECGNIKGIGYPFWGNNRPQFCGLQGFELKCKENVYPFLEIKDQRFIVLKINHFDYTMNIARLEFWEDACPMRFNVNTTLNNSHFNYAETVQNLKLFYGCARDPDIDALHFYYECHSGDVLKIDYFTYYAHESFVPNMQRLTEICTMSIEAPVHETALEDLFVRKRTTVKEALSQGFNVVYNYTDRYACSVCESSGGICGSEPNSTKFRCFCRHRTHPVACEISRFRSNPMKLFTALGISFAIVGVVVISNIVMMVGKKRSTKEPSVESFMRDHMSFAPRRYSYFEVRKMTNSFKEKLGQGGFSCVYKGKLPDDCLVAVKVLNTSKGNGEEFINEVASISRTSHVNVVSLLGYCYGHKQRALIYEFMSNGSLEKFINTGIISEADQNLGWKKLYQIAIGIARRLEYLHRGCNTRILHLDIKPHNILLDDDFCPKISDFGLAKLCPKKESIISTMEARGTIGYIAPEVFSRNFGVVSPKSDVYSYGMMVLEMAGARKNADAGAVNSSDIYFPHWIYKRLEQGNDLGFHGITSDEEMKIQEE